MFHFVGKYLYMFSCKSVTAHHFLITNLNQFVWQIVQLPEVFVLYHMSDTI